MGNNLGDLSLRGVPLHLQDDEAIPTKGPCKNNFRFSVRRFDGVVPLRQCVVFLEVERRHLCV